MYNYLLKIFVKDYRNTDDPAVRTRYGSFSGIVGILCNLLLFAAKLIIGTLSGSVSITADAVNNLSDASGSIVTLIGFRLAARPADDKHPYGYARIEYFSGLIVAVLILVIGVELGKSSVEKILHPELITFSAALVVVLVLSCLVKLWMGGFFRHLGRMISSSTLEATAQDCRNDIISTLVVLVSCVIGEVFHICADGWMGLIVAILILRSGLEIAKDTLNPLLGEAPDPELVQKITDELLSDPSVLGIHDLMVHDYGPGKRFASVHAEMDCRQDNLEAHEVLDDLERSCLEKHSVQLTIHYDPIVTDNEALNKMKAVTQQLLSGLDERIKMHDFRMVKGEGHTNLIFDVVLPMDLYKNRDALKARLDEQLNSSDAHTRYYTVITFDLLPFNTLEEKK